MTRLCEHCYGEYSRRAKEGNVEWRNRRFCSARCGLTVAGLAGHKGGVSPFDTEAAARIATDQLRDKMFSVYRSVASARGLNDVWEAAVVLGMAA